MTIRQISYDAVVPFMAIAAKEKVSLQPTAGRTIWYETAAKECFGGLLNFGPRAWRIRGIFTHPEYRGLGFGTKLTDELIEIAKTRLGARVIEVIALNPKFYEDRGFRKLREIRPGSWRLELRIEKPVEAGISDPGLHSN
jgi:ribosomal protein S18 acetylase RimI-like enzyme